MAGKRNTAYKFCLKLKAVANNQNKISGRYFKQSLSTFGNKYLYQSSRQSTYACTIDQAIHAKTNLNRHRKLRSAHILNMTDVLHSNEHYQSQQKNHTFSHTSFLHAVLKIIAGLLITGTFCTFVLSESEHTDLHVVTRASCSSKSKKDDDDDSDKGKKNKKKDKEKKSSKKKKDKKDKPENATLSLAIERAQELCMKKKEQVGCPGIVVCVSVDGKHVYAEGFGYSDLESHTPMKPNSVLRIASISKAITATIVAKLWENKQIDLDQVVQHYVPDFPEKEFLGEKVSITIRQLLNHTSGIRHYKAEDDPVYASDKMISALVAKFKAITVTPFFSLNSKKKPKHINIEKQVKKSKKEKSEMERKEYYINKPYKTTKESLSLFANDRLLAKPGKKYIYTTYGYTVLAAVVEAVTKKPFTDTLKDTLQHLGLEETYLDYNDPIIYNRVRYYVKDARNGIQNAPYVDLSYKWAGGGLLSSTEDIVKFGNILLYSAQHSKDAPGLPGYLSSSTMSTFWQPKETQSTKYYGLGFEVAPGKEACGLCADLKFGAGHSGAAIGASSALFILPKCLPEGFAGTNENVNALEIHPQNMVHLKAGGDNLNPVNLTNESPRSANDGVNLWVNPDSHIVNVDDATTTHLVSYVKHKHKKDREESKAGLPKGVVVAVFVNMIDVSVMDVAEKIARIFEKVDFSK